MKVAFMYRWGALFALAVLAVGAVFALRGEEAREPLALEGAGVATTPEAQRFVREWTAPSPFELPNWSDPANQPGETRPLAWANPPQLREGASAEPPAVEAIAAVVVDEASGAVLYGKDAHKQLPPASLTKIVTAILAIQQLDPAQDVTVDVDAKAMRGSSVMGLAPGDTVTVRELLLGLMLPSGNDAALALGRVIAGSDAKFADQMNELVAQLGLTNSAFRNPHGLNARGHYSSAYDLAMLARYAMSNPAFVDLVTTPNATVGDKKIELNNGNSFLRKYDGADGVKIGYTRQAGNTLVASATRDGRRLFVTVLNTTQRDVDAAALLDWAFASYEF